MVNIIPKGHKSNSLLLCMVCHTECSCNSIPSVSALHMNYLIVSPRRVPKIWVHQNAHWKPHDEDQWLTPHRVQSEWRLLSLLYLVILFPSWDPNYLALLAEARCTPAHTVPLVTLHLNHLQSCYLQKSFAKINLQMERTTQFWGWRF